MSPNCITHTVKCLDLYITNQCRNSVNSTLKYVEVSIMKGWTLCKAYQWAWAVSVWFPAFIPMRWVCICKCWILCSRDQQCWTRVILESQQMYVNESDQMECLIQSGANANGYIKLHVHWIHRASRCRHVDQIHLTHTQYCIFQLQCRTPVV